MRVPSAEELAAIAAAYARVVPAADPAPPRRSGWLAAARLEAVDERAAPGGFRRGSLRRASARRA